MTFVRKKVWEIYHQNKQRTEAIKADKNANTNRKEECKSELIKELGHEFPSVFIEVKYY
jgi:hypothetical protein